MLVVEEFDYWHPRVAVIHVVPKAGSIDDSEADWKMLATGPVHEQPEVFTLEELFLQLSLCDFDLNCLVNLLGMSALVIGVVLDGGGEESIDEGRLSEARFTSNLGRVSYATQATSRHPGLFVPLS